MNRQIIDDLKTEFYCTSTGSCSCCFSVGICEWTGIRDLLKNHNNLISFFLFYMHWWLTLQWEKGRTTTTVLIIHCYRSCTKFSFKEFSGCAPNLNKYTEQIPTDFCGAGLHPPSLDKIGNSQKGIFLWVLE